ncbi:unnamed protein product [Rotaria sordida]|uniref:Uncharacterized protein n=1 Tax=Rotaria sordida TaxID=392033 RepID=A0A813ZZC5_9BILA|nr:unnamed protein product [Rotaria sordida]CAF0906390.1 unnamed protein product [Rotaria sordida]
MTESMNTITNNRQSDRNNDDNPIDWFVVQNHQEKHVVDAFGWFDDDENHLTLFDLKSIPKSDHDLSVFDELKYQCDAVLLATNFQQQTTISTTNNNNNNNSYLSNQITTPIMMNEYERRFQYSLQKLTIPSWYIDTISSSKIASKPMIISTNDFNKESHRTPEIIHVQRPRSYRSCRSSLRTSPTPSVYSWHQNHITDGMNFSSLLPSSLSCTSSRRHNKYEKGIARVTKSSHWYQPTQFIIEQKNDHIGTTKISINQREKLNYNHYDIPKIYYDNKDNISHGIKQCFISDKSIISGTYSQQQSKYLNNDIDFDEFENTTTRKKKSNNRGNSLITNDKQQDSDIPSNEFKKMSLTSEKISFGRIELEEVTDDEENDKRSPTNNIHKPLIIEVTDTKETEGNVLLERIANNLVDSILNDALYSEKLDHDSDDDMNTGVRELSDDENALRELDENDMSGTDEFIVFATNAEASDHDDDDDDDNNNNNNNNNQTSSAVPRGSLNRLYIFSRTNDDTTINSKTQSSNQDSTTSELIIDDKDILRTNSLSNIDSNQPVNTMINLDNNNNNINNNSSPIYRSHIQKRHINLGRYYDGMLRATNSQLPTHDLRSNLVLNNTEKTASSEGVNEETVRQGRILLDSISDSTDTKNQLNENVQNESLPIRSILKNTRFALTDEINEKKPDDNILTIEEKNEIFPKKIVTTTITEEYRRIQRKIIEEFTDDFKDKLCQNFDYSKQQEQYHTQQSLTPSVSINDQSPYELLSECYSGYSFIRSDFLTPITYPLTLNVSSLPSTTDEAYESEQTTTISPSSLTMSSSPPTTATIAHVHPNLIHEFEYPSPPPPVPDRRLKPPHLRPPPPIKPRSHQRQQRKNSNNYSTIEKTQISPLTAIEHIMASTPNDSTSSSIRTLSSRHYCGSLPLSNEFVTSSESQTKRKTDDTLNSLINNDNNQQPTLRKSTSSSLNKNRSNKPSSTYFDEATNGLAIRLPAPISQGQDSINKQHLNRSSTPSSSKQIDRTIKKRPISENLHLDRSSIYETSV